MARAMSNRKGRGTFGAPAFFVVAYDYGIKYNILRNLAEAGCRVKVVPAATPAEDVLALNPDGIFLSNGPGDPDAVPYAKENVQKLIGKKPIFGICLGHQIMGLALGGKTYKLKFGHHGGNQPVMDLTTRKVEITVAKPRLRGGCRFAQRRGRSHASEPKRQHGRRPGASRAADLFRAVSSGIFAWTA